MLIFHINYSGSPDQARSVIQQLGGIKPISEGGSL